MNTAPYRFSSRKPQRGHQRLPVGPGMVIALHPSINQGTRAGVASKRRPGTARAIDWALTAIDKGVGRHGLRYTASVASFFEGGGSFWGGKALPQRAALWPARVGTASRLLFAGMGFVKVPGAQVLVKEKFFLRGKAFYTSLPFFCHWRSGHWATGSLDIGVGVGCLGSWIAIAIRSRVVCCVLCVVCCVCC
jgi:hypothetical protein